MLVLSKYRKFLAKKNSILTEFIDELEMSRNEFSFITIDWLSSISVRRYKKVVKSFSKSYQLALTLAHTQYQKKKEYINE